MTHSTEKEISNLSELTLPKENFDICLGSNIKTFHV